MHETQTVIIGAGPHGLAAAAHLGRAGVETHGLRRSDVVLADDAEGMLLRSNWTATSIAEYDGPLSLDSYCTATGPTFHLPVPLERFIDYGDVGAEPSRPRTSTAAPSSGVERDGDGFVLTPERRRPSSRPDGSWSRPASPTSCTAPRSPSGCPPSSSRTRSEHRDLGRLPRPTRARRRRRPERAGVGGADARGGRRRRGRSSAADHVNWLHGGKYHRMLGRCAPLVYAPTDVGPMGLSRVVAVPDLFRRLPRALQEPMAYRAIRPAGAAWLAAAARRTCPIHLGTQVRSADGRRATGVRVGLDDGGTRTVDHLLFGTGYRVDVAATRSWTRPSPGAMRARRRLSACSRSGWSRRCPGLHFLGAPAAWSFGPIMRFVAGGWYGAESLAARRHPGAGAPRARLAPCPGQRATVTSRSRPGIAWAPVTPGPRSGAVVVGGDYQGLGIARSLGRHGHPRRGARRRALHRAGLAVRRAATCGSPTCATPTRRWRRCSTRAHAARARRLGALPDAGGDRRRCRRAPRRSSRRRFRVPTPAWHRRSEPPGTSARPTGWPRRSASRCPGCWFPAGEADLADVDLSAPVVVKPAIKEHFFYATKAKAWRADTGDGAASTPTARAAAIVGARRGHRPGAGSRAAATASSPTARSSRTARPVADMTVRRRRQHPSDFGRASTYVETVDLPELRSRRCGSCAPSTTTAWSSSSTSATRATGSPSCSTSTRAPGATTPSARPPGSTSPTCCSGTSSG